MLDFLAIPESIFPLVIFCLRVVDMSMDTLRVLFVIRGRKGLAWILGFVQSTLWVIAITSVLSNLDNILNIIGYAGGFATGIVVGMTIEERLAIGHGNLRIISSRKGSAITEQLRKAGYGVTELPGRGRDGMVTILDVSVQRKDIARVRMLVDSADPDAFITVEEIRPLHRGYWRA
ncbi:MAG: DUF2179 domain-containing protein [Anaerolineales bacterium]|nr:DUF2179 domain-containing protein [Anaerolineales bacterium]